MAALEKALGLERDSIYPQSPPMPNESVDDLQHLKRVSRIKHQILESYLPPWAIILGSANQGLNYLDCFAGPGQYEFGGQRVLGSPAIAVSVGKKFLEGHPRHHFSAALIEDDPKQIDSLKASLREFEPFPPGLNAAPILADSNSTVQRFLDELPDLAPSFVMIDPYGHPLPIPMINRILRKGKVEVLINLMWFRINMDLNNPLSATNLDLLFGDDQWRSQPFMTLSKKPRRDGFLDYFLSKLDARFTFPFTIKFDPEDNVRGGDRLVKYWLVHGSNNAKAALLMKQVMYKLGDEQGTFQFSGRNSGQGTLFSPTPPEDDLRVALLKEFAGNTLSFDEIQIRTYRLPFVESQYRAVIKDLRLAGTVKVKAVSSKTDRGLKGEDLISFPS